MPEPAIILTDCRTGGTYLSSCLSNHPEIHWVRGEPLARNSHWNTASPNRVARLNLIFRQQFYTVSGCKILGSHLYGGIGAYLEDLGKRLKVLFLVRYDKWDQAISGEVNSRTSYAHSLEGKEPELVKVELNPANLLKRYNKVVAEARRQSRFLGSLEAQVLKLTYEEITQNGKDSDHIPTGKAYEICEFLGVTQRTLYTDQRKVNKLPWEDLVSNWEEIDDLIRNSRSVNK